MNALTGNKDTDFLVLSQLNDRDLGAVCKTNKYVKKLCDDDIFWKKRLFSNLTIVNLEEEYKKAEYPPDMFKNFIFEIKDYLEFTNWKEFYTFLMDKRPLFNLREAIVRFQQEDKDNSVNYNKLKREYFNKIPEIPEWVNSDLLLKSLKRNYFKEFGISMGRQGRITAPKELDHLRRFFSNLRAFYV